jgi:hypothetical protein
VESKSNDIVKFLVQNIEMKNGLVLIDFKKVMPPNSIKFVDWNFLDISNKDGKRSYFYWKIEGEKLSASIDASVCDSYELAYKLFFSGTATNAPHPPWVSCKKGFGTICVESKAKTKFFFVYKNVYIKVVGDSATETEAIVEWLSNVLKAHPLTPMLPPGPLTLAKPGYPVSKQGYWKTFISPEYASKEAPRLNAIGPLYKYPGDKLNALGFEGPPVWDNLVWIWIGENYPDQQAVLQAGKIAVERYDRERRNPPE